MSKLKTNLKLSEEEPIVLDELALFKMSTNALSFSTELRNFILILHFVLELFGASFENY